MKLDVRHTFSCTPEFFWKMYWDDEFDKMLNADSDVDREILEHSDDGEVLYRKLRMTPHRELPTVAAKLIGSPKLIYDQDSSYHRSRGLIEWEVLPTVLPGKLDAKGTVVVKPKGDDSCEMIVTGDITVNVRFIGGKIEQAVVSQVGASYDKMAQVIRQYIKQHG